MDLLLLTCIESFSYQIIPDLGLMYIASSVRAEEMDVCIKDCRKDKWDIETLKNYVLSQKPLVVGIKAYSNEISRVVKMTMAIREVHPESTIIVGGPHPSMDPEGSLEQIKEADFIFVGESEKNIGPFMKWVKNGKNGPLPEDVLGIAFRDNEGISIRSSCITPDIDEFEFPAWDLMPVSSYSDEAVGLFAPYFPVAPMILSRGCPYKCSYCGARYIVGNKLRTRSVDNIISEIDFLEKEYGVKTFTFADDSFTSNRKRALELFEALANRPKKINFTFPNGIRANSLDPEMLDKMEKAGCSLFGLGIESASNDTLSRMKKNLTVELVKEKVELTRKLSSIKITGFFILGYPGETLEDVKKTINFAVSLPIHHVHFCLFIPLPGSAIYDELIESGTLTKDYDFEQLTIDRVSSVLPGLPADKLLFLHKYAYFKFYLQPWRILGLPAQIKSFKQLKVIFRRLAKLLFG